VNYIPPPPIFKDVMALWLRFFNTKYFFFTAPPKPLWGIQRNFVTVKKDDYVY
jgi:hypothetical protein